MDASQPAPRPRLSLIHLFIWIALCAAYLSVSRAAWGVEPDDVEGFGLLMWAAVSIVHGTALGYPVVKWMHWHATRFGSPAVFAIPSHPGEYVWCAEAWITAGALVAAGLTRQLDAARSPLAGFWPITAPVLVAGIYLWTGSRLAGDVQWRRLCYLTAGLEAVAFFMLCLAGGGTWPLPRLIVRVVTSFVAVCVVLGERRTVSRPWTHWVGVWTLLGVGACALAYIIYFEFMVAGPL